MLWHWLVPEVFSPFCIFWVIVWPLLLVFTAVISG